MKLSGKTGSDKLKRNQYRKNPSTSHVIFTAQQASIDIFVIKTI
jgi:hypothetical protein